MKIVLGVSGGIAAYKAPELVRRLRERGADVRVILTPNAARFVAPLSLAAVSENGVIVDQWGDISHGGVDHVALARWAELLLIAPATANVLAKLAVGIADDALTTYAVAHRGALIVAPAMNTFMLAHPTVAQNLGTLQRRGVRIIEPDEGLLACGDEGAGRLPDPDRIVEFVFNGRSDLRGRRLLVTAGPTREPLDPVRFLSNRSSGRMGYALASAARDRGAEVTLVSGPVHLEPPHGVRLERVVTAEEMRGRVLDLLDGQDALIMAAAVADFTPAEPSTSKLKKGDQSVREVRLRRAPDILSEVGARESRPLIIGFAAETADLESEGRRKLQAKNADLIVANDVSRSDVGFDSPDNEVVILGKDGARIHVPRTDKVIVADRILDEVARLLLSRSALAEPV